MRATRFHHFVILAHVWACMPFLAIWALVPGAAKEIRPQVLMPMGVFAIFVTLYLLVRTVLAWRNPPSLRWEYIFPVIDVALVSAAVYIRDDPNSVLMYAYLLPIAEAVVTLDVRWAASIGALSVLCAFVATYGQPTTSGALAISFRFAFLVLIASLLTLLARIGADLRAQLDVAADRNRIALEMHDGVQADLVAIALQLEIARREATRDGEKTAEIATCARDLARRAADDLRFIVQRTRADRPSAAFLPALQQYAHNLSARSGLTIIVAAKGQIGTLSPIAEHALFRIVQESLTNVIKHADASQVEIILEGAPAEVRCTIRDNGRGFRAHAEVEDGHLGLEGMRTRATSLGGELRIASAPGEGAVVEVVLPRRATEKKQSADAAEAVVEDRRPQFSVGGR